MMTKYNLKKTILIKYIYGMYFIKDMPYKLQNCATKCTLSNAAAQH